MVLGLTLIFFNILSTSLTGSVGTSVSVFEIFLNFSTSWSFLFRPLGWVVLLTTDSTSGDGRETGTFLEAFFDLVALAVSFSASVDLTETGIFLETFLDLEVFAVSSGVL